MEGEKEKWKVILVRISPMILTWKRLESVMTPPNGKKVAKAVKISL